MARVFISDMTKARLEGLLDAFPKLIASDKCKIISRSDEVNTSLSVIRPRFTSWIPEYCRSNDEKEIQANLFELIFAFDEIVALGYRENVNLAQIRTFTEMDSHEERVFNQIKIAQERAANELMTQKAMELKKLKAEQRKTGRGLGSSATAISSSSVPLAAVIDETPARPAPKPAVPSAPRGGGKALKLGSKATDDDQFLKQLKSEGQVVDAPARATGTSGVSGPSSVQLDASAVSRLPVHIKIEEKLSAVVSRDGGLENGEVQGSVALSLSDPQFATISVRIANNDKRGAQLQVHPNLDKKEWQENSLLKLKSVQKPFPVNMDVVNCWPNENPDGCVVNIEYTLQAEQMTLNNVVIVIPLPPATVPVISECEGSYEYVKSRSQLVWSLPVIDETNKTGSLEFSTPNGQSDHFFPVTVRFTSSDLFCDMAVSHLVTFLISHLCLTLRIL
ncbi:unnamed protein product [Gongylonema pulchrum]|uniref:Coatomer subunit delta n=1 Tax=Gongylonema pulchrum TaxID=637853 RepID=A0A3P7PTC5_9BILA|nr:unnamed protein product [Gongylonema pulchrum]